MVAVKIREISNEGKEERNRVRGYGPVIRAVPLRGNVEARLAVL
jgi:hypothetical protein